MTPRTRSTGATWSIRTCGRAWGKRRRATSAQKRLPDGRSTRQCFREPKRTRSSFIACPRTGARRLTRSRSKVADRGFGIRRRIGCTSRKRSSCGCSTRPWEAPDDGGLDGTSPATPERGRDLERTSPAKPERGRETMMRTRFAPSPTGDLHLGGAWTALASWVVARRAGGRTVLRVEDLDRPRAVPGSQARIEEDMRWLGLDWDEGPHL